MTRSHRDLGQGLGRLRRCLVRLAMLSLLAPAIAFAAVLAEPDARAVRQVVQAQLDAFAADDAERAFSYASASIRGQFGDASTFAAMVRSGYPMVVRPTAVSFFQAQAQSGAEVAQVTVRQNVQLRDREGRLWMATYVLERQAGAGWRINGCVVVADSGKSLT
jgi:Domain of unknown function (DUF4864)